MALATILIPIIFFLCRITSAEEQECKHGGNSRDQAWLTIVSEFSHPNKTLSLLGQTNACYKSYLTPIPGNENCSIRLDTKFPIKLQVVDESGQLLWKKHVHLSEHGEYALFLYPNASDVLTFNFVVLHVSGDVFIPIYVALGFFAAVSLLWIALRFLYRNEYHRRIISLLVKEEQLLEDLGDPEESDPEMQTESATDDAETTAVNKTHKERLRSLDAFRGMSLTIMIFVNYGGGGYWFFDHSYWNGLTLADLVFPWFTWIIGTALALSIQGQMRRGKTKFSIAAKIIRRTCVLFALGIVLGSGGGSEPVDVQTLRIPGVLQRLAISYLVVALLHLIFAKANKDHQPSRLDMVRDITDHWPQWGIVLVMVACHLGLTFLLPISDVEGTCPTGYLGPGGLHEGGKYENCTGGAAAVIDRWFFSRQHVYQTPTCKEVYKTVEPHDPEGILGTLTSIFLCFLGLQAGVILTTFKQKSPRMRRWIVWGIILGLIAGLLCGFKQDGGWIPVNKNLWSLSFVLGLASMAFVLLAVFYLLIDVHGLWSGAPFLYPGMNSIAVYVSHIVFQRDFPVSWKTDNSHASLMALHLWGVTIWVTMAFVMHLNGIHIAI
ncbi:hypothetical protein CAPTEDRAFT_227545 [Capitella teleta]|uniref:Uncharacterized protein n=1 Tax=Capitella teleta TaxID=283909 RepID=R7TE04_CAPTE|nr:hypothetical protein CAPTEDRAFT_227545 [Capitella teleta]|eukprot:ELT89271.1 hypothetical protein CAPTEDRAFT_227545 [Capitella teleta]